MTDSKPPSRRWGRPLVLVGLDTGVVDRLMAGSANNTHVMLASKRPGTSR